MLKKKKIYKVHPSPGAWALYKLKGKSMICFFLFFFFCFFFFFFFFTGRERSFFFFFFSRNIFVFCFCKKKWLVLSYRCARVYVLRVLR